MIVRADRLGGVLYYAESKDGGRTWPEYAKKTTIPNPGSKATLYGLGGDTVAILHNPNPRHRSPLALWISFDGLKTWPYRRVLVPESCDKGGALKLSRRLRQPGTAAFSTSPSTITATAASSTGPSCLICREP